MEQLRVGILSTGNIAATMAETVVQMKEARIYAVLPEARRRRKPLQNVFRSRKLMAPTRRWLQMKMWIWFMWPVPCRNTMRM